MKNILLVLFAVCVGISFSSCSSGDYNANPANGGTTIVKDTTKKADSTTGTGGHTGLGVAVFQATAGSFSANINGTAWAADLSSIVVSYDSSVTGATIVGTSGTGASKQEVYISMIPISATTFPIGSSSGNNTGALNYLLGSGTSATVTQGTGGSIIVTTAATRHYIGTFTAASATNPTLIQGGTFDITF